MIEARKDLITGILSDLECTDLLEALTPRLNQDKTLDDLNWLRTVVANGGLNKTDARELLVLWLDQGVKVFRRELSKRWQDNLGGDT